MVFEKILGIVQGSAAAKHIDTVPFEWFEQERRILKKTASSGEEVGLRLNEPLVDGGVLYEDDTRIIALSLLPCEVIRVAVSSMTEMGRLCFELGNRHLPVAIGEGCAETPYDSPCFEYLCKLGFSCEKATHKFAPTVIVRGHGSEHQHGHEHGHSYEH